jgi:cytoskeletal protein CcmA (bactofilin family)
MKNPFLKKLINILEKEVCQDELPKEQNPLHCFKPFQIEKKSSAHDKPANIASKCLKSQETILSEGVCVKGELHFEKQLRINGSFEGSLHAQGKVIIGPKGCVKGDIHLDEATIYGIVIGNITVNKLTIGPTAQILGNVHTQQLDFQKGAKLVGNVQIDPGMTSADALVFEQEVAQ